MRSIERTGNAELRFRLRVQQSNRELLYFIDFRWILVYEFYFLWNSLFYLVFIFFLL